MKEKDKIIDYFYKNAQKERKTQDNYTYWWTLDIIDNKEYAIVMGWQDGFDTEDGWELNMKMAYLPTNSGMSEYNIDWIMPYDENTNEVWDTELTVSATREGVTENIEYLLKEYEEYKKLFLKEDN